MNEIVFKIESGEDVTIFAADGENLLTLARKANVAIDAPCSGNGSCGKCRIKLLGGSVGGERSRFITDEDAAEGWRLACLSAADGDAVFLVPDIASAYLSRMKIADLSSTSETAVFNSLLKNLDEAGLKRGCGIVTGSVTLTPPSIDETMPDNERLCRVIAEKLGLKYLSLPYPVLKTMPELLRDRDFSINYAAQIYVGDGLSGGGPSPKAEILSLLPDGGPVCGLAIDIGTTTVSGLLVDLETGGILAKAGAGNAQIRYGADIINRIIEQQKPGGIEKLRKAITDETLLPLIEGLCRSAGVTRSQIYRMTIASNTTMNHLLLGVNANFLRTEPYVPAFFELEPFNPALIGIELAPTALMSLAPNIGSYVGGDITAGTLAGMLWNSSEMSVLIDLGTNGEIVFGSSDFLMACACSAGPAFEGGDISCGIRAVDGAIEACTISADTMEPQYTVIGGGKPVGLCGSGLIDVVAGLFSAGIINGKGKFIKEGDRISRDEYGTGSYILTYARDSAAGRDISINEVDLDNFIRAKGAIFSAVMSLLTPLGFTIEDIGRVLVAGGIGSGINIKNAISIGMLPDLPEEKYSYIGNSSLTGAYAMLISSDAQKRLHETAKNMTYIELSTQPGYMDEFIAACFIYRRPQ